MSGDDILDDMSLSDDEMLDSLADDMLLEIEVEGKADDIEEVTPIRQPPRSASRPMGFPVGNIPQNANAGMPDLGKMMSQMMPMMSQMFGNNNPNMANHPLFGGARGGGNAIQEVVSWEDTVKKYVPANEQEEWLRIIQADGEKLRADAAANRLTKPHSRSYRPNVHALPNVYMEVDTLMANMLNEAVRAAHCEHSPKWKGYHENAVSQIAQSGLAKVFERDFKNQLRQRVANDPDYLAMKDSDRFKNITQALFT